MKVNSRSSFKILYLLFSFFIILIISCSHHKEAESYEGTGETNKGGIERAEDPESANKDEFALDAPPFTDGIFPCNDCHIDIEPNPVRRDLVDMHDDITAIFDHDSENRWCLDCHDNINRDSLRLASGKLIGFDESYKLCGQCHGDKLRDWKVGIHGLRTGEWNGKKQYLLCVHCHNPHSPGFEALEPLPPPVRQEDIRK